MPASRLIAVPSIFVTNSSCKFHLEDETLRVKRSPQHYDTGFKFEYCNTNNPEPETVQKNITTTSDCSPKSDVTKRKRHVNEKVQAHTQNSGQIPCFASIVSSCKDKTMSSPTKKELRKTTQDSKGEVPLKAIDNRDLEATVKDLCGPCLSTETKGTFNFMVNTDKPPAYKKCFPNRDQQALSCGTATQFVFAVEAPHSEQSGVQYHWPRSLSLTTESSVDLTKLTTTSSWSQLKTALNVSANEFANETTAHGYKRTCSPTRRKGHRLLWSVAILVAGALAIASLSSLVNQWLSYRFSTTMRYEPSDKLPFPAVTVCNLNVYDPLKVQHLDNSSQLVLDFLQDILTSDTQGDNVWDNDSMEIFSHFTTRDLDNMTGWTVDDFLLVCKWNSQPVRCSDIFVRTKARTPGCFTFNTDPTNVRVTDRVGSYSGLAVLMNGGTHDDRRGVKVLLHDYTDFPDVRDKGLLIAPDTSTYLSVHRKHFKFLAQPYKAFGTDYCSEPLEWDVEEIPTYYPNYTSHSGCVANCVLSYLIQECHCVVYGMDPDVPGIPYCAMDTYYKCYLKKLGDLHTQANFKKSKCNCAIPCSKVEYSSSASATRYPDGLEEGNIVDFLKTDEKTKKYIELKIFYDDLVTYVEEQTPIETWVNLLSNMGGQIGLLTGASVLTILEFLELLIFMGWTTAKMAATYVRVPEPFEGQITRNTAERESDNKDFEEV